MPGVTLDVDSLKGWIGRTESRSDQLALTPVAAMSATLDREDPAPKAGDALPPLWHWLYFLPIHPIEHQAVQMDVQAGGRTESLY